MAFAALTIDLNARLAKFEQDMARAGKSLDGLDQRATAAARGLKTAFGALGATLSVGVLASFAKSGIDAADALNDMSQRLGVSVKDLASFKLIAEQSGTSLDSVGAGIARLSKSIGEAELGNKNLADALKQLGITARNPKEAFFQLADAVQRIEDPTKRAALLSQVLGKSYNELVPLLKDGGDALRASAAASESFSDSMAKLAPDADKFNDQLAEMKQNAAGLAASLLTSLVPALNEMMSRIVLVKNLIGQGGLFNTLNITAGTSEISTVLKRVKEDIIAVQGAIDRGKSSGKDTSGFEERLRGLNAQLAILKQYSREAALALGKGFENYKVPQTPGGAGTINAPTGSGKAAKAAKLEEIDPFYAQRTAAMKAAADQVAETERQIAEHLQATNAAIYEQGQAWTEAGRALEDEMRTPLENANIEFARLQEMLDRGVISWETYTRAVMKTTDALAEAPKQLEKMDTFAKTAAKNIQNSFADFLFDPFHDGLKGMAQSFGEMIKKMIADAVAADLTKKLFGDAVGGSGSGLLGGALSAFGSLLGFSNGGVMTGSGAMPLKRYASGGIASSPQFAMFGEGSTNEAFVPLPDGRAIPVKMKGSAGNVINVYVNGTSAPDVRRAAGQGAREALGMLNGAQRYA